MLDGRKSLLGLIEKYALTGVVNDDTELYRDLGIYGDDADEFFREFVKLFGISGPGQFAFNDYFPSEGEYSSLGKAIGLKDTRRGRITVGHLLRVIEQGNWIDPPLQDLPVYPITNFNLTASAFWHRIALILIGALVVMLLSYWFAPP